MCSNCVLKSSPNPQGRLPIHSPGEPQLSSWQLTLPRCSTGSATAPRPPPRIPFPSPPRWARPLGFQLPPQIPQVSPSPSCRNCAGRGKMQAPVLAPCPPKNAGRRLNSSETPFLFCLLPTRASHYSPAGFPRSSCVLSDFTPGKHVRWPFLGVQTLEECLVWTAGIQHTLRESFVLTTWDSAPLEAALTFWNLDAGRGPARMRPTSFSAQKHRWALTPPVLQQALPWGSWSQGTAHSLTERVQSRIPAILAAHTRRSGQVGRRHVSKEQGDKDGISGDSDDQRCGGHLPWHVKPSLK